MHRHVWLQLINLYRFVIIVMHWHVYLQLIILYRFVIIVWQQDFSFKANNLNTNDVVKC